MDDPRRNGWVRRGVIAGILVVLAVGSAGCASGKTGAPPYAAGPTATQTSTPAPTAPSRASERNPTTTSQAAIPAGTVGILDCEGTYQVRPSSIVFACGDGGYQLTDISWSQWADDKAVGTATESANDCVPNCAAGTFHERQVSVTLGSPHALADGSAGYFTRAVVSGGPDAQPEVLPLPEAPLWRP
jgi:hypothetical protein